MAKVTLSEIQSLPDPLTSDLFELVIGRIPGGAGSNATTGGGSNSTGGANTLRIQCQQVAVPSKTVEGVEVLLSSNSLMFAGRIIFEHAMNVTFVENRRMDIFNELNNWANYCRDNETQLGHYKADYSTTAQLIVYDQMGKRIKAFEIYGLWINVIPEFQFDGTAANLVLVAATFQMDYWKAID